MKLRELRYQTDGDSSAKPGCIFLIICLGYWTHIPLPGAFRSIFFFLSSSPSFSPSTPFIYSLAYFHGLASSQFALTPAFILCDRIYIRDSLTSSALSYSCRCFGQGRPDGLGWVH
ncbi:hypothetical protein QBC33DRAFT_289775 [Phialemonium atrogriseum]|uniref:Uncharacterized protein n=1 Tax=Phialemonium atrogriseum TaxID=1093897 RepID=A0AAJ0BRQ7_9PEZI|nr:uncharacterized protein QBC33DRAFT_289775 [Phialemonium atrogriseum]KAK1762183.1 hypothetical protein QBC33DRAFT_289775 [Phialemonium atrogriseum]